MRVVQTVFGVFHHFELARELAERGHLARIYSTWPWSRLKREAVRHDLVETYPWVHTLEYAAGMSPFSLRGLTDDLGYANALLFDRFTLARLQHMAQPPQALVAISGSSLRTGAWLQQEGGVFICDRGSTHQRFQEKILAEEYARWGQKYSASDPRDTIREETIYQQADVITVPSTFAAESFRAMGVPAAKLQIIPYGVRVDAFRPLHDRPLSDTFNVLFTGAVGLRKGIPYLLEAFAQLRHPRKKLRIIGAMQPEMRAVLHRLPRVDVEILGSLPQPVLARHMANSDVLVLPSVEDGFGLVMAQAMAAGCPVLASSHTGASDLFTHGVEGLIVPARSTASLLDALEQMAQDPPATRQMGQAAMKCVRKLGWHDYGRRWEDLLRQLTTT